MDQIINVTNLSIVVAVLAVLNVTCLILILKLKSHYNHLVKDVTKKTLMSALEGIQKTLSTHERGLAVVKKEIAKVQKDSISYLQNITLKRFNPFSDTGGDQSFLLGILDGNKDGVVITSLHSRENTRFYVKAVKSGEGVDHPLSKEEKKILNK